MENTSPYKLHYKNLYRRHLVGKEVNKHGQWILDGHEFRELVINIISWHMDPSSGVYDPAFSLEELKGDTIIPPPPLEIYDIEVTSLADLSFINKFSADENEYVAAYLKKYTKHPMFWVDVKKSSFISLKLPHSVRNITIDECDIQSIYFRSGLGIVNSKIGGCYAFDTNPTDLKPTHITDIHFINSEFLTDINLIKLHTPSLLIINCEINQWLKLNSVEVTKALSFEGSTFNRVPCIENTELPFNSSFDHAKFEDIYDRDALLFFRGMKNRMQQIGNEHDMHMFHALELESRLHTTLKDVPWYDVEKFSSKFLMGFHRFGRDLAKPLGVWLMFGLVFWAIFVGITHHQMIFYPPAQELVSCDPTQLSGPKHWLHDACAAPLEHYRHIYALYTMQDMLGPVKLLINNGLLYPTTFWVRAVSFFHALLSTLMLYLIIVGVRRRFKV